MYEQFTEAQTFFNFLEEGNKVGYMTIWDIKFNKRQYTSLIKGTLIKSLLTPNQKRNRKLPITKKQSIFNMLHLNSVELRQ